MYVQTGAVVPSGHPALYYGPRDSAHSLSTPWQYTNDRSRPLEPRFFTMRPNQQKGNGSSGGLGFRASSQPPPHPGSGVLVSEPPINAQGKWYRSPIGWSGAMVTGSAGSLDKVSLQVEKKDTI